MALPTNTPIPIPQDSQLVINNVPNYNRRGTNTKYKVAGIGVQDHVLVYAYNTTNRASLLVASSSQITSQSANGILGTKKTPVMMVGVTQCVNQGNGVFIIGPGTADTPAGYAASITIQYLASAPSGIPGMQPYPANKTAKLFLDPNNQLPTSYYLDLKALNQNSSRYIQITSNGVQQDLRMTVIGYFPTSGDPDLELIGVIYLDDTSGITQNQNIVIDLGITNPLESLWLLPLIAYDPPTNLGSFDIGDPKNDAVITVSES